MSDRDKNVAHSKFMTVENRPRCDAELLRAFLTAEETAGFIFVNRVAGAARANRLAFCIAPADSAENLQGLVIREPGDGGEGESARGGRQQEMLPFA